MERKKTKVGILGYGEVGQAIAKFYTSCKIKDLNRDDGFEGIEILHICLPYMKNFVEIVRKEIKAANPRLVIIHSTTAPGTTKAAAKGLRAMVVHSPIRGMHPGLYEGVKTFVKYIGADNKKAGKEAEKHLRGLGIKTKLFSSSVTTEMGKLLDTTYYGLCIAWHGEMKKMCDKVGANFEEAVVDFNQTYNEGYSKLGKKNVIRPVLYAPKEGIAGHCIIPNAEILKENFQSQALDLVLRYRAKNK